MIQRWKKLGMIFCPSGEQEWMQTHAAVPVAENIGGDLFKIYFSSRDGLNRSYTGYVIIDINNPACCLEISCDPILSPGLLGQFDDSGAMATWVTTYKNINYLYFIGWNLGVTVPFRNSIGLAISQKGGKYAKYLNGPILDRSLTEPHFVASCCVLPDSDIWRMWYLSCTGWDIKNGVPEHRYHIKYAESENGIQWTRRGEISIDYADDNEYAISRPSVLRDGDIWKMWFSHRGKAYRIGYAESTNGRDWRRLDNQVGINVSIDGWDSEMIEYPFVFDHKGSRYMLYNGNGYGKTGFGLAIMESQ